MRVNATPPAFPASRTAADLRRLVTPDLLAVARIEPVFTRREQASLCLDLTFSDGAEILALPAIRIAHEMLVERESSVLLWPHDCAAAVPADVLDAVEDRVLPWMLAQSLSRQMNTEIIRRFSDAVSERSFELARSAAFAGAAPYGDLAACAAPYYYARRFADAANIGINDRCGATGAALLAPFAQRVQCDLLDAELNALARAWFGRAIFGPLEGSYEVGIQLEGSQVEIRFDGDEGQLVEVATPVPTEICVSFDPEDAPPVRSFRVMVKQKKNRRDCMLPAAPAVVGGSSGRILIVRHADSIRDSLADGDDAAELQARLSAEGFTAELRSSTDARIDLSSVDLLHVFGAGETGHLPLLDRARERSIPIVATAAMSNITAETRWGTGVTGALMRTAADETAMNHYMEMIAKRRLNTNESVPSDAEPVPGFDRGVRAVLSKVDLLLVSGAQEEQLMRTRFGYTGQSRFVPAYLPANQTFEPVDALAGTWDFILAHAPIAPYTNLSFLVRAARQAGMPLVIAGPVADSLYFAKPARGNR